MPTALETRAKGLENALVPSHPSTKLAWHVAALSQGLHQPKALPAPPKPAGFACCGKVFATEQAYRGHLRANIHRKTNPNTQ